MATAQSVILDFLSSLNSTTLRGTAALDEAVAKVSNFRSWSKLTKTMVADCKSYSGDGTNFLNDMCGIILDNSDTGAITGSDAGGGSTKTAESVVSESGSWSYPTSTTFTKNGLTFTVPEQSTLSEKEQYIVGALNSWWVSESLNLASSSFGMDFYSNATVKDIDLNFYNRADGRLAYVSYSTDMQCDELHMYINMNYYSDLSTTDPNGVSSASSTYLDRTIAHELTHAVMAANINYFAALPTVFTEGSAELVHGIDDKRRDNIDKLSKSSSALQSALTGTGADTYAAGYMALRYLAKQAAADRDPSSEDDSSTSITSTTSTVSSSSVTYSGTTMSVTSDFNEDIWLGDTNAFTGEASTYANSSIVALDASKMTTNHILAGNSNDNYIVAGSGGSSIWGGAGGNDTMVGGADADMFWYLVGNGNDVIQNFTSGQSIDCDILNVHGNGISSFTRNGGNINLTMIDGASVNLNTTDVVEAAVKFSTDGSNIQRVKVGNTDSANTFSYDGNVSYYFGGNAGNTLTIDGADIYLSSDSFSNITTVDASSSSNNNLLYGDSASNTLIGGAGTTNLWGGESSADDLLIGGTGQNIFRYGSGEGTDTITNAKSSDTLNLYNLQVSDIINFEDYGDSFKVTFSSGTLNINNSEIPTANLADGTSWTFNTESRTFSQTN